MRQPVPPPPSSIPGTAPGSSGHALWDAIAIVLLAAGLALVVLVIVAVLVRRGVKIGPLDPRRALNPVRDSREDSGKSSEDFERLQQRLERMRDELVRLSVELDAKAQRLEALLGERETRPDPVPAKPRISVRPIPSITPPSPRATPPSVVDRTVAEVYRLSDEGLPVVEIARLLGQHAGAVELMLALRTDAERG